MPHHPHGAEAPDPEDPEDVLSGRDAHDLDHEPADGDDREVALDDPDEPAVPIDDED